MDGRPRKPTLLELQTSYDATHEDLENQLSRNPAELLESEWVEFADTLKSLSKKFSRCSRNLCSSLQSSGAVNEAFTLRTSRVELQKDTQEVLAAINHLRKGAGYDVLSNLEFSTSSRAGSVRDRPAAAASSPPDNRLSNSTPHDINTLTITNNVEYPICHTANTISSPNEMPIAPTPLPICNSHPSLPSVAPILPHSKLSPSTPPFLPTATSNNLSPQVTPPNDISSSLQVLSQHLLQQELLQRTIEPFDGSAIGFWPWLEKIRGYTRNLNLTPLQTLQLLETHSRGEIQRMVSSRIAATGEVTEPIVQDTISRLASRYGSSHRITSELLGRVESFPPIRDPHMGEKLNDLCDLGRIVEYNMGKCPELMVMNLSVGLRMFRVKLPEHVQNHWRRQGQLYEDENQGNHPPFSCFLDFLDVQARQHCNKNYETLRDDKSRKATRVLRTHSNYVTDSSPSGSETCQYACAYHKSDRHNLIECKGFLRVPFAERKKFVFSNKLCFRCLGSHRAENCSSSIKCNECGQNHATAMHRSTIPVQREQTSTGNGTNATIPTLVSPDRALCTRVCDDPTKSINCSKTILVEISMKGSPLKVLGYAILDEQANVCLADSNLPHIFGRGFPTRSVSINFASDECQITSEEQVITGLVVRGVGCTENIELPEVLTCNSLVNTTDEVATPQIVKSHPHIAHLAENFNEMLPSAQVLLLIGRNCGAAMKTTCYGEHEPYAHHTPLGWALVGRACSSDMSRGRVLRTSASVTFPFPSPVALDRDPFVTQKDDDFIGLSQEDRQFLNLMQEELVIGPTGHIEMPLPLKTKQLPPNKLAVFHRTKNMTSRLKLSPQRLEACVASIDKSLKAEYIEPVPKAELTTNHLTWYLPIFPVEQPKKDKVRLVYDAAAKYQGTSLNDVLIQGPDMLNQLRGILLRFREKPVAFVCDIEAMYNSFKVPPDQRNLLRFFWFEANDPTRGLVEYRSTSHVFGAKSSPAVANYGLKFTATHPSVKDNETVQSFIRNAFYVDDGVSCAADANEARNIIGDTINVFQKFKIRLHKIMCNSQEVLNSFPKSEVSQGNFDLCARENPIHKTLGMAWIPSQDCLVVQANTPLKPFTKRGVLSVINSVYDPLGIVSPVTLAGRLIQREVIPPKNKMTPELEIGWDDPLPSKYLPLWTDWVQSLSFMHDLKIPRCYCPSKFQNGCKELHIFADASENAIGHVAYLRFITESADVHVSFVFGESKVAPRSATSIPRLEICAAVDAANTAGKIVQDMELEDVPIYMYSDSKIVLGYITNTEKRFSKYIERRISSILQHTSAEQWRYVSSHENPGDIASRGHRPTDLAQSIWFTGPEFLQQPAIRDRPLETSNPLPEERQEISVLVTHADVPSENTLVETLCTRVSSKLKLLSIIRHILKLCSKIDAIRQTLGFQLCIRNPLPSSHQCLIFIVKQVQLQCFSKSLTAIRNQRQLTEDDRLCGLSPFIDNWGVLRVGGRLNDAKLSYHLKHPILLPNPHPLTELLLNHYHLKTYHQGRHLTHSAIREAGFHILDGKKLVQKVVRQCVTCQKLRGSFLSQQMASLPLDRVEEVPPFLNIGIDVMGPFFIHDGVSTRKNPSLKKTWALVIVCMSSRAVHIEPLPAMDVTAFRNAFTRFKAIRGKCKLVRSDRGSNFICAKRQMSEGIEESSVKGILEEDDCVWELNPVGASHFGGCYERKIGSIRRILEGAVKVLGPRDVSRDEFATLLQEAACIINNTPLWEISSSTNDPYPLTPANLLTLRTNPNPSPIDNFTKTDLLSYGKRRWRRVQFLADQFWTRWRKEYLHTLQRRNKWKFPKKCASINDIVLIRDKNVPRNNWKIGVIAAVHRNHDGLVRSADIRLSSSTGTHGLTTRAIHHLVRLIPASE